MKKIVATVISVLVAELILMVLFVNSGLYNVSTLSPDPGFLHWIFSRTSDNSARVHSKNISIPPLNDSSMVAVGFVEYNETCVGCHGAPGVNRSDVGAGLYPHPPNLVNSAKQLPASRLFWVAKNGIKSTGMPGFAGTHNDKSIWSIVAFLEKMKNMTPQEYAAMVNAQSSKKNGATKEMKAARPFIHR